MPRDTHDTFQCKHPGLQKRGCKSAKPACKTIIPALPTDTRENRVLSPWLTHSCVFSWHPRGFITSAFHSIIPSTPGLSSEQRNKTTCQGRRTKREHVEQRIRLGEEVCVYVCVCWGGGGVGEKGMREERECQGCEN